MVTLKWEIEILGEFFEDYFLANVIAFRWYNGVIMLL